MFTSEGAMGTAVSQRGGYGGQLSPNEGVMGDSCPQNEGVMVDSTSPPT